MSTSSFDNDFKELTGETFSPYPWQRRLYDRLIAGDLPDALDLPTGLGKTSTMAIWLLARRRNPKLPMRLIYVVNRRAIVDQASAIAEALSNKPGVNKLAVSTLRGALADNREWMRRPNEPAIVVGTVDMIGSRLLFDAYRAPRWHKSMHAGLLGQDTLIVHDEAHLSVPFQKLIEWVRDCQQADRSPRPMRVLAMSATGAKGKNEVFQLDAADYAEDQVKRRVDAKKRLRLHEPAGKIDVAATLAELAANETASPARRVIVFVRTPATAAAVVEQLREKHGVDEFRIELLTGTIRGHERDKLVETETLSRLLNKNEEPLSRSVYLVSTSAGEVGADFDADHLVCDVATLDSMIQRLGRVNRRGNNDALVDVVVDVKEGDKHSLIAEMLRTVEWLGQLPEDDKDAARRNASPQAIRNLRQKSDDHEKAYQSAIAPPPACVPVHSATLDAWALTSIQDPWAIAPPLDDYLHGLAAYEPPQTTIAWREEIAIFFPPTETASREYDSDERLKQCETWLELCPLRPHETVADKSEVVMSLLVKIADRFAKARQEAGDRETDDYFVRVGRRTLTRECLRELVNRYDPKDKLKKDRFLREIADETFIFPTTFGGLTDKGMLDASCIDPAGDVADVTHAERLRVWLAADGDDELSPRVLGRTSLKLGAIEPPDAGLLAKSNAWCAPIAAATAGTMRFFRQFVLRFADERRQGVLLLFKPPPVPGKKEEPVWLEDHCADVGRFAGEFAAALIEDAHVQAAVAFAGRCHDLGKGRALWQESVFNAAGKRPLAKSLGKKGMNPSKLKHYRHEFGSLIDTLADPALPNDGEARELALHLIAVHHGRGRPHFAEGAFEPNDLNKPQSSQTAIDSRLSAGEIARRYASLQRRYGHWGLAWLESLVTCADHAASRGETPEDETK